MSLSVLQSKKATASGGTSVSITLNGVSVGSMLVVYYAADFPVLFGGSIETLVVDDFSGTYVNPNGTGGVGNTVSDETVFFTVASRDSLTTQAGDYTFTASVPNVPSAATFWQIMVVEVAGAAVTHTGPTNSLSPWLYATSFFTSPATRVYDADPDADPDWMLLECGQCWGGGIATTDPITTLQSTDTMVLGYRILTNPQAGGTMTFTGNAPTTPQILGIIAVRLVAAVVVPEVLISEVEVTVTYQNPGNYIYARDINSWGDEGDYGQNNGSPYAAANVVLGSITLSQPGAELFPLQHIVGYFDAVGCLGEGGASSYPDVWIMPNEISVDKGIGFVYLPEILQEPPQGQNKPSMSLLSLRWPINMMNSDLASQYVHHLQVKIQFEPECAPNTIKAISFKSEQS